MLTYKEALKAKDRLFSNIKKTPKGCWEWQGSTLKSGYGQISVGGYPYTAHRVSWTLHNKRQIPSTLFVLHKCDNRKCVNPSHLWLGTHQDNMDDAKRKKRTSRNVGRKHPQAKYEPEDILNIRLTVASGVSAKECAEKYSTSQAEISQIVKGKSWSHIGGPIKQQHYTTKRKSKWNHEVIWINGYKPENFGIAGN